jgi:hypothetical protein
MWVVEGGGGMWLRKMGENGRKWDEIPIFLNPIFPFFRRSKAFPTVPFVKISSPTEKWEFLPPADTHRHNGWCGCWAKQRRHPYMGP